MMFQPKTRRALVAAALVSALSLLPAHAAAPRSQKPQQARSEKPVAVRLVAPIWDLVTGLWSKFGSVIDPNGRSASVSIDANTNHRVSDLDGVR